jgi:hypothetical protein
MVDEGALLERAREVIEAGLLPNRPPDRMWGGPGGGAPCAICGTPATAEESELELEFGDGEDQSGERFSVHARCFAFWDAERRKLRAGQAARPPAAP